MTFNISFLRRLHHRSDHLDDHVRDAVDQLGDGQHDAGLVLLEAVEADGGGAQEGHGGGQDVDQPADNVGGGCKDSSISFLFAH